MKLDKEKFSQLKQLDRIEFRQRLRLIEETYDSSCGSSIAKFSMYAIAFTLLLIPQFSLAFGKELAAEVASGLVVAAGFFIILIFIGVGIDIVFLIKKDKEKKKLEKEYFNLEVKK